MADDTAGRLARIEHEISKHRSLYLRATWAGHQGEAAWHETEVDKLIGLWQRVRDGFPYTLAELDGPVSVVSTVVELP